MNYTGERFLPEECKGEIAIEHYQRYHFACSWVQGKTVLDAACGEGYGSSLLSAHAQNVIGLDIDPDTLTAAEQKYGSSQLTFVQGSVSALPFEDHSFDVVISFETIEHVDEICQKAFLSEIRRVLKPNGLLIMSTPNKSVYTDLVDGNNAYHVKEFYIEEYKIFLASYFKNVRFFVQFPDTGYFFTEEGKELSVSYVQKGLLSSRYVVAVCSDGSVDRQIDTDNFTQFDDEMYYFLYRTVHTLEGQVVSVKVEAEQFQARQEASIAEQKQEISHLLSEIDDQKNYIDHLEKDIEKQKSYITHLEADIGEQKSYVDHLEKDIGELKSYIERLEK